MATLLAEYILQDGCDNKHRLLVWDMGNRSVGYDYNGLTSDIPFSLGNLQCRTPLPRIMPKGKGAAAIVLKQVDSAIATCVEKVIKKTVTE